MGALHEKSQVKVDGSMGLIVFLINTFFWPGLGTIIAGMKTQDKENKCLIVGLIQMFTAVFLIGWIWSIITGWKIYQKSK